MAGRKQNILHFSFHNNILAVWDKYLHFIDKEQEVQLREVKQLVKVSLNESGLSNYKV